MKSFFLYILIFLGSLSATAQKRAYHYKAETGGALQNNRLPFWLYTNQYGKITQDAYLWGNIGLFSDFQKKTRANSIIHSALKAAGYWEKKIIIYLSTNFTDDSAGKTCFWTSVW